MSVKKHKALKWKANHDCPIWWDFLGLYWNGKDCSAAARGKGYNYYVYGAGWGPWKGICFSHHAEGKSGECGFSTWWGHKGYIRSFFDVYKVEEEAPKCDKPTLGGPPTFLQQELPHAKWTPEFLAEQFDLDGTRRHDARDERSMADLQKHGLGFLSDPKNRKYLDKPADAEPEAYKHYKDEDWEEGDELVSPEMAADEADLDKW
jgi:hypothetical protein